MRINPWIIAHRGASGDYPENTLIAFWEAIKSKADIIECDLQLTADNRVIVFHDKTVERIFQTKEKKTIRDYELQELKKIDVGSWFNSLFSDLRIPTLDKVIESLPRDTSMILEIKSKEEELINQTLDILDTSKKSLGLGYISVKDIKTYKKISDISDRYQIGLMQKQRTPKEFLEEIETNNIKISQIRWRDWKEVDWLLLNDLGCIVTAILADEEKDFAFLCNKGVDGILTNFPVRLLEYLKSK